MLKSVRLPVSPPQMQGPVEHNAKEYSEYNNINDVVREGYIEWAPNKTNQVRVGRQIAIWGEALTTRVGDVIHPDDSRYSLIFANLEDTRIPSWMVRGIHDIPSLNSSFEWIYNPNFIEGKYTVNRTPNFAAAGSPGQRFGINPDTTFDPGKLSVGNQAIFGFPFIGVFNPLERLDSCSGWRWDWLVSNSTAAVQGNISTGLVGGCEGRF